MPQSRQRVPNAKGQVYDTLGCLSTLSLLTCKYDSRRDWAAAALSYEVPQVVSQDEEPQPHLVGYEPVVGETGPVDRELGSYILLSCLPLNLVGI